MRSVAIIDDSLSERVILRGFAEEGGFEVVAEGQNGKEAIEICKNSRPDLVIMDVGMPVKDGIEASLDINRTCPTPVILLTGRIDEETIKRAAESGAMAYLVKPVRKEELFPAMELALSRFSEFQMLRKEIIDLKNALDARKLVEKAKGLLMEKEKLTEGEAFARIRKISMDKRKSMKEIAEVIILAFEGK